MNLICVNEGSWAGAYFSGKSDPIEDLVKKYGFTEIARGQSAGSMYSLQLTEGDNVCGIVMSFSKNAGVLMTGVSNNKEYISGKMRAMLTELNASEMPQETLYKVFVHIEPLIRASIRDFAIQSKNNM
jgi:hypothetical protein